MEIKRIQEIRTAIKENIQEVIVGKDKVIDLLLVSMFCSEHLLVEHVPNKT